MTVTIVYADRARKAPTEVEAVLREVAAAAGVAELLLTSTARTVADQARIMTELVASRGATYAHDLYGAAGDAVIVAIARGGQSAGEAEIRAQMARGQVVSRHVENADYYAVDVSPRRLGDALGAFVDAARRHARVRKVIPPPGDPAVHVEIALTPTLRFGSHGPAVVELQRLLGVAADGEFGARTLEAVVAYQRSAGLVADGEVGPLTWAALRAA